MPDPAAAAAANHSFGLVLTELHKKIKNLRSVREDCRNLQLDHNMFGAFLDDVVRRDARTNVSIARGEEVRELVHDIEDCIERYLYRITSLHEARTRLSWVFGAVKTLPVRNRLAKEIKKLNQRVKQANDRISRPSDGDASTGAAERERDPIQDNPVGFAQAKQEVLALLDEVENEPRKLRVIAIVGFGGSGKTTLASAVYKSPSVVGATRFPLRAWVDRAHYTDASSLLKNIILQFWPEEGKTIAESSDEMSLQRHLKNQIEKNRYLIVLDDMNMELWRWVELTFEDQGTSSRIIVTTSRLRTANLCSSSYPQRGDGYVYQMRSLCDGGSQTLARLNDVAHDPCPCHQGQCQCPLEALQKKCDGLPLALVSVARHFSSRCTGRPTTEDCTTLCNDLGSLLHRNPYHVAATAGVQPEPFADLRGVLLNNFISLADDTLVACCLLYLGIFPDPRRLKRSKITRRWVAEGYGRSKDPRKSEQRQADEFFQNLIDLNIIQPVGIRTSRTCKAVGIVHEFVLHKTMLENFIMTIDSAEQSRTPTGNDKHKSRHLFLRGGNITRSRATMNMDLSRVRSLTVVTVTNNEGNNLGSGCAGQDDEEGHGSGSACAGFFKFGKYKVIRVLDLEECTEVNNCHLRNIYKLWNLRYLSLGPKVDKLPQKIARLKRLERLHLSKTKVTELPGDIIGMPCLMHLIGKFMLLGPEPKDEIVRESKLETLSGIVADRFLPLVPRLKNLRKVKIYFDQSDADSTDLKKLFLDAIRGYLKRRLEHDVSRSLSIDFKSLYKTSSRSYPQEIMVYLHDKLKPPPLTGNYYLRSVKLHDKLLSPFPLFVTFLSGLTKLSLSLESVTQDILSAISELPHALENLKLVADEIPQDLVIHDGKFRNLRSLCFVVRQPDLSIPRIQIHGVLPELRSFQLISKLLADHLCGIQIRNLTQLQEIELHPEVSDEARQEWETAARNHPNRPNVLPFRNLDDPAGNDDGAAAIAVAGVTPVATAVDNTTTLEGYEHAENITASGASLAGEEPSAVPVPNPNGNALGQEPAVIDPVAGGALAGDEPPESLITTPTQQGAISQHGFHLPAAIDESPYPASSVPGAGPEDPLLPPVIST